MNHNILKYDPNDSKRGIAIFGFGRQALALIDYMVNSGVYQPVALIAKSRKDLGKGHGDIRVMAVDGEFRAIGIGCIISPRDPKVRRRIHQTNPQIAHWTIMSFTNQTSYGIMIGEGSVVAPGASISAGSTIGKHCLIERNTALGVNVVVGDYSFLDMSCTIMNGCQIGNEVSMGAGSLILEDINVGDKAIIYPGSVVISDVKPGQTVAGNPATALPDLKVKEGS